MVIAVIVMLAWCFGLTDYLYYTIKIRRAWRRFVREVKIGDNDSECIKLLEARVLEECKIASQYRASRYLSGRWHGTLRGLYKISDLEPTGMLCYDLLEADREILTLLRRFEEFESAQVPLSNIHIKITEAHIQILDNIECAVAYLRIDGCLDDCDRPVSDDHYSNICRICESNDAIIASASKLAEQAFDLMLADFVRGRSKRIVTDLKSAHSELKTVGQPPAELPS